MKLRKLFAGVAAAATLLGGMAFGATTANAADATPDALTASDGTITLNGAGVNDRDFAAVQVGSYLSAVLNDKNTTQADSVEVATVAAVKDAAEGVLKADTDKYGDYVGSVYGKTGNPLGYVAENLRDSGKNATPEWSGKLRDFVTALAKTDAFKALVEKAEAPYVATGADDQAQFTTLPEGLYVVVDKTTGQTGEDKYGASIPMFVGTKIAGRDYLGTQPLGTVEVKNYGNPAPTKSVEGDTKGTVNVGDKLTYTVEGTVPNTTGYDTYSYQFKDYPGTGLTVNLTENDGEATVTNPKLYKADVKVYVADEDGKYTEPLPDDDVTVAGKDEKVWIVGGDGEYFTATVANVAAYSGRKIKLVYAATVNAQAKDEVTNEATVNPNGQGESEPGEKKLKTYGFKFTKTDADGNNLTGAQFTIKNSANKYIDQRGIVNDTITGLNADQTNGVFTINGLKADTYTVEELSVPSGFLSSVKAQFTVTISEDGTVTYDENPNLGLVTGEKNVNYKNVDIKVKNVKSVTQLPLTGAAGTVLFSVVALLIAGAAVTVFAKSRSTKRALNA